MNNNLIVLPIVLPMVTGVALLLVGGRGQWQRLVAMAGTGAGFVAALALAVDVVRDGIQTLYVGGFPPPFAIVLVADMFSAMMVVLSFVVALAVLLHSFVTIDREREQHFYYAFVQFIMMGLSGSFLTGDIFNLFVWFEVTLISSYILVSLGGERVQLREGFKYVIINSVASSLFLVGVAALYASVGTVNMADLAVKMRAVQNDGMVLAIALLFLVVFGTKAAIFPLYFWLPRSYDAPPPAVAALFGGLLTKVGVYVLIRIFTLIFAPNPEVIRPIILWAAALTLIIGVLGALAQTNLRRIISYHVISHIGFMLMGVGIATPLALAGSLFYIAHDTIVKPALFLMAGIVQRLTGTMDVRRTSGLIAMYPGLAALFFAGALALAGIPPLSGFFGKFMLIQGAAGAGHYSMVAVIAGVSLLIVISMLQTYRHVFWGELRLGAKSPEQVRARAHRGVLVPSVGLVLLSLAMGLGAGGVAEYTLQSAAQLINTELYIEAVFGSVDP